MFTYHGIIVVPVPATKIDRWETDQKKRRKRWWANSNTTSSIIYICPNATATVGDIGGT
jgi:hypothetical protein